MYFPLSCTRNSSVKEKQMAVLGGRRRRKKEKKESDNHLVAAFPTRRYKSKLQDLQQEQGFLLCPRKAFLQLRDGSKKLVLT